MVRPKWLNLNGLWEYAIVENNSSQPSAWDGQILVPFPVESALSGVMKTVGDHDRLWYRRTFTLPRDWRRERILLHFGAVDWDARVWVNGQDIGEHQGGYDGFSFDITSALRASGPQQIVVAVTDPTDAGTQPRGKQVRRPASIWYTSTTGIWQTTWVEPVPFTAIESIGLVPDVDAGVLRIDAGTTGGAGVVRATAFDGSRMVATASGPAGRPFDLAIPSARLWSPDSPHLYDLTLALVSGGREVDRVKSYFGMRVITLGPDSTGTHAPAVEPPAALRVRPARSGILAGWPLHGTDR